MFCIKKFFIFSLLWTFVPVWANGDCRENARAILVAEENLREFFDDLTTLTVKRELDFFEIEAFEFEYNFFTLGGHKLDFNARVPEHSGETMAIFNNNDERILDFDRYQNFSKSKQANVSTRGVSLGTIRWKPFSYGDRNFADKMFELCSSQGGRTGRTTGRIHVPRRDSQIFPLFDSHANRAGKIFNNRGKNAEHGDTFLVQFPENWKNSEKALFLAAALIVDTDCYFE